MDCLTFAYAFVCAFAYFVYLCVLLCICAQTYVFVHSFMYLCVHTGRGQNHPYHSVPRWSSAVSRTPHCLQHRPLLFLIHKYSSSKHSDLWHCVKFCVQCIWVSKFNQMLDVANKTAHFFNPLLLNCNRQAYSLPNYIKFVIQGWIPCSVWKNKQAQVESRVDIEDLARVMIQKVLFRASIEKISKKEPS